MLTEEGNPRQSPDSFSDFSLSLSFAADFGGADLAHGGVAGTMAGAPHVPAGDGAVGTPALAESEEFFGFGLVFFAVGDGPAFLYAQVVDGKHVGAAEAENQKHFDGPGANAADRSQPLDEFFVGEFLRVFESGDSALDRFFGEIFHGDNFRAREAGFAKSLFAQLEHFLRRGRAARRAERFDPSKNGGGRFTGDGLVSDSFQQRFIGVLEVVEVHLKGFRFGDERFQFFVAFRKLLDGFGEVKRRTGRCGGHNGSILETGRLD